MVARLALSLLITLTLIGCAANRNPLTSQSTTNPNAFPPGPEGELPPVSRCLGTIQPTLLDTAETAVGTQNLVNPVRVQFQFQTNQITQFEKFVVLRGNDLAPSISEMGTPSTSHQFVATFSKSGEYDFEIHISDSVSKQKCAGHFTLSAALARPPRCSLIPSSRNVTVGVSQPVSVGLTLDIPVDSGLVTTSEIEGQAITRLSPSITVTLSTAGTFTYEASVSGPGGTAFCDTQVVSESAPAPALTLLCNGQGTSPVSVTYHSACTVSWTTNHATSCTLNDAVVNLNGSLSSSVLTTSNATYTLRCSGNGGSTSRSIVLQPTPPPVCATLYERTNYLSSATALNVGEFSSLSSSWDYRVSSVRVTSGCTLTLYDDRNYGGWSLVLTADRSDLGFRNDASSAKCSCP